MLPMEGELRKAAYVVLVDGKLFLDFPHDPVQDHRLYGYYFKYPGEKQHLGLVSTISDDPPILNWIFVDRDSGALRYGGRKDTIDHVIGP
ncbi:hypothetical protein ACO1O0_000115 [Amphichorda felina]